jgi:very-short-patch-repair endonuclease
VDDDLVEAWIATDRIWEAKRRGWEFVGPNEPGRALMRGDPESFEPIAGKSPPFPEGATDFAGWPQDLPSQCESAIERRMISGLLMLHAGRKAQVRFAPGHTVVDEFKNMLDARKYPGMWLHVFPQVEILQYRLDFLAVATGVNQYVSPHPINTYCMIAIECDGSAWHTAKWKDDQRDDEVLRRRKIHTLRFPGGKIWHEAERCADEVCLYAVNLLWPPGRDQVMQCTHWPDGWRGLACQARDEWQTSYSEELDFPDQDYGREADHA